MLRGSEDKMGEDFQISVSIEELISKLEKMTEEGYCNAKLTIDKDFWNSELRLEAFNDDEEDTVSYGSVNQTQIEF